MKICFSSLRPPFLYWKKPVKWCRVDSGLAPGKTKVIIYPAVTYAAAEHQGLVMGCNFTKECVSRGFKNAIRMQHWCRPATDGAEFWISCKRPAFLSSFSRLQVIQNKCPRCSAAVYVTAGYIWICSKSVKTDRKLKLLRNDHFMTLNGHFLQYVSLYFFFQLLMFLLTLVFILLTILFTQELQGVKTTLPYLLATSVYYLTTGKVSCFSD